MYIFFQYIRNESSNFDYTYNESKKVQNRSLNRYRDVSPYDQTRVVLTKGPCDYINANLVQVSDFLLNYAKNSKKISKCTSIKFM